MKINKLIIPVFFIISFIITSCNTSSNEPKDLITEWKIQNETYFVNMKDSTAYTLYTIPAIRGGNSFYYNITTPGDQNSVSPLNTDSVLINYRGREIDGFIFDQTFKGSGPLIDSTTVPQRFYVNQLIKGWKENMIQMKVGEKRTIVLPQELGYGTFGVGLIPPYSTLIFEIQLISIIK